MRIESGLYSSKEGLHAHGQALGVISDNVSNANTVGFKRSRVEFSDLFAEGGEGRRSTAESVPGNGVKVASVRQIHQGGVIEFTGRSIDAAIDGNGYFVVGDANSPGYTRAGNFSINDRGLLVTSDGHEVLGFSGAGAALGPLDLQNLNITGTATTEASIFANLFSGDGVAPLIPQNPETFLQLGQNANFISSMTVYDSFGIAHDLTLGFFKTDVNNWTVQAYANGDEVAGGVAGQPVLVGTAQLRFGPNGSIVPDALPDAGMAVEVNWGQGAEAGAFNIDFTGMTQFGGATVMRSVEQNGQGAGEIADYEFDKNGSLWAVLESGSRALVGRVALAGFTSPDGLERAGSGIYLETQRSGPAAIGTGGAGGLGTVQGAALERSTVDIANEFVELVVFQRGYQANSQTLNTISTVIRDTLSLIR